MSNVAILHFWWHFLHILELYVTFWDQKKYIWLFWAFYAVLSQIRFVVIYRVFWVKLFCLKPCLCKKVVFFHLWAANVFLKELLSMCFFMQLKPHSSQYTLSFLLFSSNCAMCFSGNIDVMNCSKRLS